MEIFLELKKEAGKDENNDWNKELANGLAFLALSIEELHSRLDSQDGPKPEVNIDEIIEL